MKPISKPNEADFKTIAFRVFRIELLGVPVATEWLDPGAARDFN